MMRRGQVVLSSAGRDKGRLMAVLASDAGGVLVAEGKERPLERPKRKNPRHLTPVGSALSESSMATNRALRRALAALQAEKPDMSQEGG